MKNPMKYFLFAIAFAVASCGSNKTTGETKDSTEKVLTPEEKRAELIGKECENMEIFSFCTVGLSFLKLGDTMINHNYPPAWRNTIIPGATVKDTIFDPPLVGGDPGETVDWYGTYYRFDDGFLLLESDPIDDRYLQRIIIETPRFKNLRGIHVGMTFGELLKEEGTLSITPYPATKDSGTKEDLVQLITMDGLLLFVKNNGYYDPKNPPAEIAADKISPDEKIVKIAMFRAGPM
jgi:hypothetical protein